MNTNNNTPFLLEQYKLCVEMADRVSSRRIQTNQFYLSLLTALLGIVAFALNKDSTLIHIHYFVLFPIALLGLLLCLVWYFNLESYRQLNSGKFQVINDMETQLPYACFTEEWQKLKADDPKGYFRQTKIEKFIPMIMAMPYAVLAIYSICS
jgi:hypothetical protein